MKALILCFALLSFSIETQAQNMPATMQRYIQNESENWKKAYYAYGEECLPNLKAGALVPSAMSVDAKAWYKYVKNRDKALKKIY